jgi:hypothetical protein
MALCKDASNLQQTCEAQQQDTYAQVSPRALIDHAQDNQIMLHLQVSVCFVSASQHKQ